MTERDDSFVYVSFAYCARESLIMKCKTKAVFWQVFAIVLLSCAMVPGRVLAQEAPPSTNYALTIAHVSDAATWTQTARVEIVAARDSFTVTLRNASIIVTAADADLKGMVEQMYGGFEGATASVTFDDRGNVLTISDVSSPAATDQSPGVTEGGEG